MSRKEQNKFRDLRIILAVGFILMIAQYIYEVIYHKRTGYVHELLELTYPNLYRDIVNPLRYLWKKLGLGLYLYALCVIVFLTLTILYCDVPLVHNL
jgi:hypothetical protein